MDPIITNFTLLHLKQGIRSFSEILFSEVFATRDFYIKFAVFFAVIIILGKILNKAIGASERGWIATTIGLLLPLAAAVVTYAYVLFILPNYHPDHNLHGNISLIAASGAAFFVATLIAPIFLGTSVGKSLLIFFVLGCLAAGSLYFTEWFLVKYITAV